MTRKVVRLAALGDLHCTKTSQGMFQPLFARVSESADVLLLAGDLTDYGLPEEARVLARELASIRVPIAAVLGNHDLESDKQAEVASILVDAGVALLDGDACELQGIGIAGVKGFGGGVGQRAPAPSGRAHHQAVRARSGERGAETRSGARAAAHLTARRLAALLACTADMRRRTAGDLSVRRIEPPRGTAGPLPGLVGCSWSRPPRSAR